jgi:hypothetical protein
MTKAPHTNGRHTRVSGICLFHSSYVTTPDGESWRAEAKLIPNPHARFELPQWIPEALATYGSQQDPAEPDQES